MDPPPPSGIREFALLASYCKSNSIDRLRSMDLRVNQRPNTSSYHLGGFDIPITRMPLEHWSKVAVSLRYQILNLDHGNRNMAFFRIPLRLENWSLCDHLVAQFGPRLEQSVGRFVNTHVKSTAA
jgi:hypothetical protein